jgi:hypothetical protein
MRTIEEYAKLAKQKYDEDHDFTNISEKESVNFVVDTGFFNDEFSACIIEPLKIKIAKTLKWKI